MSSLAQRSFAGGEVAPELHARADLARYAIGLRTCRNMVVLRAGGVTKRPGTKFVDVAGSSDDHWIIHTFGPGTPYVFTDAFVVTTRGTGQVRALLVAGGASGGCVDGTGVAAGGGGAGGVIDTTYTLPATGSYPIAIGAGGLGRHADHTIGLGSVSGTHGDNSTAFGFTAIGGGKGDGNDASAGGVTSNGGSGGGAAATQQGTSVITHPGGTGTAGQGHNGGGGVDDNTITGVATYGGGGGGAGTAGKNGYDPIGAVLKNADAGQGGDGIQSDITGVATYYGGGGGGGSMQGTNGAFGGLGGGGRGGPNNNGTDGLGGGGGGGNANLHNDGGRGGHGVVIVRYKASSGIVATGGTITTVPI